jgi:hypothetical protein
VTENTQPPGRTALEDGPTVDSGPVEFTRGIDSPNADTSGSAPVAGEGGDAAGGESDD